MFHLFSVFPTSETSFSLPRMALLSPPAYKSSKSDGAGGGDRWCLRGGRQAGGAPMTCGHSSHPIRVLRPSSRRDQAPSRAEPECSSRSSQPSPRRGVDCPPRAWPSRPRAIRSPECGQTGWAASLSPKDQEEKKHQRGAFEKWRRSSRTELPLRDSAGRLRPENGLSSEPGAHLETFRGVREDQVKTPTKREGDMRTKRAVEAEGCRTDTGEKRWTGRGRRETLTGGGRGRGRVLRSGKTRVGEQTMTRSPRSEAPAGGAGRR